jgi:hypothetical protein
VLTLERLQNVDYTKTVRVDQGSEFGSGDLDIRLTLRMSFSTSPGRGKPAATPLHPNALAGVNEQLVASLPSWLLHFEPSPHHQRHILAACCSATLAHASPVESCVRRRRLGHIRSLLQT